MRRAEVARMRVEHLDLDGGNVLVPISKTGKFRVAPLSPEACKLLRVYLRKHPQIGATGPLWIGQRGVIKPDAIQRILDHLDAPSAHAFRRGWASDRSASPRRGAPRRGGVVGEDLSGAHSSGTTSSRPPPSPDRS